MATLTEMRFELRTKVRADSTVFSDEALDEALEAALVAFNEAVGYKKRSTIETTANQRWVALPDDCVRLVKIIPTGCRTMPEASRVQLDMYEQVLEKEDYKRYVFYTWETYDDGRVYLNPTPSQAETLDVVYKAAYAWATLPDRWERSILTWAQGDLMENRAAEAGHSGFEYRAGVITVKPKADSSKTLVLGASLKQRAERGWLRPYGVRG